MCVRKWGVWVVGGRVVRSVRKCGVWLVGGGGDLECEEVGSVAGRRGGRLGVSVREWGMWLVGGE